MNLRILFAENILNVGRADYHDTTYIFYVNPNRVEYEANDWLEIYFIIQINRKAG